MNTSTIAFIPLARTTFDINLANQITQSARNNLIDSGFTLLGPDNLITDIQTTKEIARELSTQTIDLLVIFQATFADSTMVTALAEEINDAPIYLWAVPEKRTGGRLRLNSLCGINLAGHALTLRNRQYDFTYAPADDHETIKKIKELSTASNIKRRLRKTQLGVVGEHPDGMDSCHLDEELLTRTFGITIHKISLDEVFKKARGIEDFELEKIRSNLGKRLTNLDELEQKPLNGTISVYKALKQIAEDKKLDGLAVRCWPEFFTEMGCAACGAMSLLSDGFNENIPIPCSCEADINGTITQLILQWCADEPAFGTDMVSMDFEDDSAVFWHCGLAPLSMSDPTVKAKGGIHSNRKVPLVMEFPLKPGKVTLARLSQATGELRLVIGSGEMLSSEPAFSGTSGVFRFRRHASQVFTTLMTEGLEHHVSLVYGEHLQTIQAFARLTNIPTLEL